LRALSITFLDLFCSSALLAPPPPQTFRIQPQPTIPTLESTPFSKVLNLDFSNIDLSTLGNTTVKRAIPPCSSASPLPFATSLVFVWPTCACE